MSNDFILPSEEDKEPEEGIGLSLSGGGYRAMIFHVGSIWRLYEAGLLAKLDRVSSVSGGSITAGQLALAWDELVLNSSGYDRDTIEHVFVNPIRYLAGKTIDVKSILTGLFFRGSISSKVDKAYQKYIFNDKTLQDLPDRPRFVFNATNVQSGVLWRFSKPYMRDYRVGEIKSPNLKLSTVVAASSAFPPILSPMLLKLDPSLFTPETGNDLQREPFTSRAVLSDGGVYDNLGIEPVYKRYKTILVSDAGGQMEAEKEPKTNWASHSYRVLDIIDNQVRSLRKRQLVHAYIGKERDGTYWGIRTNIRNYKLDDVLDCEYEKTLQLADTPTRLKKMDEVLQQKLINWGYAVTDAAIRKHYDSSIPKGEFPYKEIGV